MNAWLKRSLDQSPGLQRIIEVERQSAEAKSAEEARRKISEDEWKEFEAKRQAIRKVVEEIVKKLTPILEEVRDFANRNQSYPLGPYDFDKYDPETAGDLYVNGPGTLEGRRGEAKLVIDPRPSIVMKADISVITASNRDKPLDAISSWLGFIRSVGEGEGRLELRYGYKGTAAVSTDISPYPDGVPEYKYVGEESVVMFYGLRLRVEGETRYIQVFRQKVERVPEQRAAYVGPPKAKVWREKIPAYRKLVGEWTALPSNEQGMRQAIADAFHDPAYLGAICTVQLMQGK